MLPDELFDPGYDFYQQVFTFQVRAGSIVWEFSALPGSGGMYQAAGSHSVVTEENTRPVFSYFKGVFAIHIEFAYFAILYVEMVGDTVDINSIKVESGLFQLVAAVSGAVVAVGFTSCKAIGHIC